jgi:hypothetical protein
MGGNEMQKHVFGTYISLRYGMTFIGALLPIVLYAIGVAYGIPLAGSMSEYYWARSTGGVVPARDVFVGGMFAVAACLYLYKGFSSRENGALNLAGLFAAGIAIFPMADPNLPPDGKFSVHGACGVLLFLCLAFVIWFCPQKTLALLSPEVAARYRKAYNVLGVVMLASPVSAFIANAFWTAGNPEARDSFVYWVEVAGIMAFAAYWWTKSREFKVTNPMGLALVGQLDAATDGQVAPPPTEASPAPA